MDINLSIPELSPEDVIKYQEILVALISCGGLSGVKGGKTIIHFDQDGIFTGIELDYWPWRRRAKVKTEVQNVIFGRRETDQVIKA